MLQKIGDALKGKKTLSWLIIIPLAVVFAIWGATGAVTLDFIGPKKYAAKVEGNEISLQEASRLWQDQQSEWAGQFGTDIPEDLKPSLQDGIIERLIRSELISARTREAGYRVDGSRVQESIRGEQAFQVDGQYNETLALARLAQLGITADQYRADIRRSLQGEELQRALFAGEFLTATELGRRIALEDEQREVRYALFPIAKYRAALRLSDADLAAWYQKNSQQFLTPESVRLQFAESSVADVSGKVIVAESDLLDLYAKNKDRYVEPERRRARHILLATEKEANDVLAQLKSGDDFEALATRLSKDTGSAASGGDLGFSEKSAFVTPFAEAVFSMKEGELRGPVKTEFGFHVVRLEGVQAGRNKTFEEVRADLDSEFRRGRIADLFGEKQDAVQQRLEKSGADLAAIAKELGLKLGESATFLRGTGSAELPASPELESLVFGDAVLNQRRIGGPIALGEDRFVVVKVLEHRKPTVPPLAEVRAKVLEAATNERATEEARKTAESVVKVLGEGGSFDTLTKGLGATPNAARFIDRRDPSIPAEVKTAAYELARPAAGKTSAKAVVTKDGAAVVVVSQTRVLPSAGDAAVRAARGQQLAGRQALGTLSSYVEDMREKAKVTKNPQAFQ
ncbi:MAG: peptidyl-prolyl cis-trans isomerase [Gammaproteobacteria bacterium]